MSAISNKSTSKQAAKQPLPEAGPKGLNSSLMAGWTAPGEYFIDAMQRTVLFWDVLRQRSDQFNEQKAKAVPHVLNFDAELLLDARTFERPVNYLLVKVTPPKGVKTNPQQRPFVVVDPRAGHGPGIGGFKADSELGMAMAAGHPCYFIGFTPEPMPGQTIEDIMHAEAIFLEKVIALHPDALGKPCIIGNCQAGWAVMMLAATRPELCGPVIAPGSPLSYWAGVQGENPMRYTGGLTGGSWITEFTSDLGNGKFDGGNLVNNFENLNPANTLWSKNYDIWSTIDTGAARFLEFEKWWGGHVNLNGEEIQWIVDQLFVGNKLSTGKIVTKAGERIDLRNIRSPIICFCSKGDNITPPQQALGWITDLYASDEEIRAYDQTIIYAVHESVGHLGIFVSGGIAKKEHQEFANNIDLIDVLPPGLYEIVLLHKTMDVDNPELVQGDWIARFEPRTLNDIKAIVQPDPENERLFETVKRVSEINLGLYRQLFQPAVRALVNEHTAEQVKKISSIGSQYEMFSSQKPLMPLVATLAEHVREHRKPVSPDNPCLQWQRNVSDGMVASLDNYRVVRDQWMEKVFLALYSSPVLQAMIGVKDGDESARVASKINAKRATIIQQRTKELNASVSEGGIREAAIRSLLYIGMAGLGGDERTFNELRLIRAEHDGMSLSEFKQAVREQYLSLLLDQDAALIAIPSMLPTDLKSRSNMLDAIRRVANAAGKVSGEKAARLAYIESLFSVGKIAKKARKVSHHDAQNARGKK